MRPWRVRVTQGSPAMGGLAFYAETVLLLPSRYWTKAGAWRAAAQAKAYCERHRPPGGPTVLVDVVHRRELAS